MNFSRNDLAIVIVVVAALAIPLGIWLEWVPPEDERPVSVLSQLVEAFAR
jgi:hypothetical protein